MNTDWMDWFERVEDCCRSKGWVWANVVGYSFHYFGNSAYWDTMGQDYDQWKQNDLRQPRGDGLKQFLNSDVGCNCSCDGHLASLCAVDDRPAFSHWYDLAALGGIEGSRPLCANYGLLNDTRLYRDNLNGEITTAAIVMNGTNMDPYAGVFIHSGLGGGVSDYTKGYIAAVLAIEEARSYIMEPTIKEGAYKGCPHFGTFTVSMIPGAWGKETKNDTEYAFVDLLFTLNSYYRTNYESGCWWDEWGNPHFYTKTYHSDIEDVEVTRVGADAVFFDIDENIGIETNAKQMELMQKIGWWGVGTGATMFFLAASQMLGVPLPFAGFIGLIPIYLSTVAPPGSITQLNNYNFINGIETDKNNDDWCSSTAKCRIYFPTQAQPPSGDYAFNCKLTSWISCDYNGVPSYPREQNLTYSDVLHFTAKW